MENDSNDVGFGVEDGGLEYNSRKDYTSLEAWKKTRLMKLHFMPRPGIYNKRCLWQRNIIN